MPYTLLLADDSVTIQRVIELTFADEDVTVVAVSDGDQAIERLEASPPDIVLADIGMPGKNGYEVAHYVRQSPKLAHIPVVLLTGAFEPVDQARADEAGCNGVLAKPFEPQLVISRVKELLARPRGEAAVQAVAHESSAEGGHAVKPSQGVAAPQSELNDYFDRLDAVFAKVPSDTAESSTAPADRPLESRPTRPSTDLDWFSAGSADQGRAEPWDMPQPAADVATGDLPLSYASPQPEPLFTPQPLTAASHTEWASEDAPAVEAARVLHEVPTDSAQSADARAITEHETVPAPDERLAPIEENAPVESGAVRSAIVDPPAVAATHTAFTPLADAVASTVSRPSTKRPMANMPPLPPLADAFAALLAAEQGRSSEADALWQPTPPPPAPVSDETIEAIARRVLDRLSDTVNREIVSEIASKIAERLVREEIERIKDSIK